MPLTWNEIRTRAHVFVAEWVGETRELAESKSFWDAFFNVFGITRRRVAVFEGHVDRTPCSQSHAIMFNSHGLHYAM